MARGGDREALEKLFAHCRRVLRRRVPSQMPPQLHARYAPSDVVQQALLEAVRDFAAFRGECYQELLDWLNRIVQNNVGDLLRYQTAGKRDARREVPLDDQHVAHGDRQGLEDGLPGPEQMAASREEEAAMWRWIAGLPPHDREVLRLRYREHLGYEEIGARLGCSPDAARMVCRRVLRRRTESPSGS
jgi:RNA polymerase sigma-70 factor (subfamily 1)